MSKMAMTDEETKVSGNMRKGKEDHMKLQNDIIKEVRGLFRNNIRKIEEKYLFRSDADLFQGVESFIIDVIPQEF